MKKLVAGFAAKDVALIAQGGGGFFWGYLKAIRQGIAGIDQNPILRCRCCDTLTILCPKCEAMLGLNEQPGDGALLSCSRCQSKFGHCEVGSDFERLLDRS
jgi:hypothetical protein